MSGPLPLDIGTTEIQGRSWGRPGSGTPIVLVHGLGGSSIEWIPTGPTLADQVGTAVVAPDLPGFGRTDLGAHGSHVPAQGRALVALLEQLGPAVVVGNSMGGLIAVGLAARRPDLVRGLVLVDPALPAPASPVAAVSGAARFLVAMTPGVGPRVIGRRQARQGPERHVDERLRVIVHRPERVDPEVRAAMVELSEHRIPQRSSHAAYAVAARSIFTGARSGWRAVGAVRSPTLALHGRHDALVPVALVDRLRALRPDWDYEVFDDAGHLPHLEQPEEFLSVLTAWLGRRNLDDE